MKNTACTIAVTMMQTSGTTAQEMINVDQHRTGVFLGPRLGLDGFKSLGQDGSTLF